MQQSPGFGLNLVRHAAHWWKNTQRSMGIVSVV